MSIMSAKELEKLRDTMNELCAGLATEFSKELDLIDKPYMQRIMAVTRDIAPKPEYNHTAFCLFLAGYLIDRVVTAFLKDAALLSEQLRKAGGVDGHSNPS